MIMDIAQSVLVFLYGLVLGSFYNVVIYRLPRKQSLAYPASSCPGCGKKLSVFELIPILSFLMQGGKCRGCRQAISYQYPLVELVTGLGFVLVGEQATGLGNLLVGLIFFSLLLVIAFIDLQHKIVPNVLSVPGIVLALGFSLVGWSITWQQSILGIVIGGLIILVISLVSRGGMGMGDMKLLAMVGGFLGPWNSLLVLFWASVFGSIFGIGYLYLTKQDWKTPIPFGPFIAGAALLVFLLGA